MIKEAAAGIRALKTLSISLPVKTMAKPKRNGKPMQHQRDPSSSLVRAATVRRDDRINKSLANVSYSIPIIVLLEVGGKGGETDGKGGELGGAVYGEGMSGTSDAPKAGTGSGLGQAVKNMLGGGPTNGFHTYARIRMPSSVPEEAVKKGARKPKEMDVGGEQTPHLPHHSEGQGDKMPAVRNSASLPSKMGDKSSTKANQVAATGTNEGKGPSHEMRPTGTASSPGSRAVDPSQAKHSPSFSPSVGPSATYTHVIGTPEPDSHQQAYTYSTESANGSPPSGIAPRSSTSTSPYPNHTTDGILKNEAGIGSSNSMINEPLKGADEMMDKQDSGAVEAGQAGDDVGGRGQTGGRFVCRVSLSRRRS